MLNIKLMMAKLTICMFLMMILFSRCESLFEIVPDGPAWLGENLTLTVNMPWIQRPIVWKSHNYKYECDVICANGADYKVTHTGNRSTLWIREVSWKFSRWQVQDDNLEGGKLELNIKVKPKIEINNTDCEYTVQARDSLPMTSIDCFYGNKPLEFTSVNQSNSSDGTTFNNIATLSFSDLFGNVTCNFTIGEIFREIRRFPVECKYPPPRNCTSIIVFFVVFQLLLICGWFLFWKMRKQIKSLKRVKGEDTRSIKCIAFIVTGLLLAVLFESFAIALLVLCLKGRQMISDTIDIVLLVVFDAIFLAWITAGFIRFIIRKINPGAGGEIMMKELENFRVSDAGSMHDMMQQAFNMNFDAKVLDGFVKDAAKGHTRNVRKFIKNHLDEIDKKCSGVTALQVASHKGHKEIVSMLLEARADLELKDDKGNTALHFSAMGEEREIMELLLSKGAKIDTIHKKRRTALHKAVNKESVEYVRLLLKHSAAINIQDSSGDTAFHDAIRTNNKEIIDMLTSESKIDFKIRNKRGFNALHQAAINGSNFATKRILEKCPDIVNVEEDDGFTALHLAALNGHREVANTLILTGGAKIDIKNKSGQTPLFLAAMGSHIGLIELLISKKAEVNIEDENGNTCLHFAVSKQNIRLSNEDLEIIENVRSQLDLDEGERAEVVIACYLVSQGANPYYKNRKGVMPLDNVGDQSFAEKLERFVSLLRSSAKENRRVGRNGHMSDLQGPAP